MLSPKVETWKEILNFNINFVFSNLFILFEIYIQPNPLTNVRWRGILYDDHIWTMAANIYQTMPLCQALC